MGIKAFSDIDEEGLGEVLVGRRVLSIDGQVLTLDNETQIELVDTADYYAWFEVEVLNVSSNFSEKVITEVTREDGRDLGDGFIAHVVSQDKTLFDVVVEGVWEWGYCANSIDMYVRWGKSRRQF